MKSHSRAKVFQAVLGIAALATLAYPASANAQLIASESFNYAAGSLAGDNPGAAAGWASAWSTPNGSPVVVASGLSYPASTGFTAGGNALSVGNGALSAAKITYSSAFDASMTGNGTYYASALIDMTVGATGSGSAGQFDLSSGVGNWVFGIGSGGNFLLKTGLGVDQVTSGAVASLNTTYFLVSKLVTTASGNDTVYLNWYTSASSVPTADPGTWMLSASVTGASAATGTYLTFQSGANGTYLIDEINLGSSWNAVASAVPEPSTTAALLLGAGLLGFFRRSLRSPCRN